MMLKKVTLLFTLVFLSFDLLADTYRAQANYFIRSSPRFSDNARNTVGLLARGSTFRVLERVRRGPRTFAARIQVISHGPNGRITMQSRQQWISMSSRSHFTRISTDPRPTEAQAPEGVNPNCTNCPTNSTAPPNAGDLVDLAQQINDDQASDRLQSGNTSTDSSRTENNADDVAIVSTGTQGFRGDLAQQIANYSSSREVSNMIQWARHNVRRRSIGLCYRLVKEAIANQCGTPARRSYTCRNPFPRGGRRGPGNNLIPSWYADGAAVNARNTLKQFGFVNLMESEPYRSQIAGDPNRAPKGAILVYSGGRRRCANNQNCGHIEIKTDVPGRPGYISDYELDRPITQTRAGGRYRLVGVMIKPEVQ